MEENVYSAPKSDVEVELKDEVNLANRGTRLLASIIDTIIIMLVVMPVMYVTGGFDGFSDGAEPGVMYTLSMGLFSALVFFVLNGSKLINKGQTIGKGVMGIRIVTMEGNKPEMSHLAKRYGFYMIVPNIPLAGGVINFVNILFIFGNAKRCGHDYIGGTQVITGDPE